jgi:methylmalonyl-CoA mutase cobalamin-binding subunit
LGSAFIAVPVTEVARIPTWQEIAQVHTINRKCEEYIPMIDPYINWGQIEKMAAELVAGGKEFFNSALETMTTMGVDVKDPCRVLIVMKRLGAEMCEQLFGAGARDDSHMRGHKPVLQTDLVRKTMEKRDEVLSDLANRPADERLKNRKVLVASTDVHEFAKFLLSSTFEAVGSRVIDCGINRDPEDIVKVALETGADAVVITTHNGVARSFGTKLLEDMQEAKIAVPVFMGGVLNEDIDGSDIPVDVRNDLHQMGIETPDSIDQMLQSISARVSPPTP